jgi:hypothetical protein
MNPRLKISMPPGWKDLVRKQKVAAVPEGLLERITPKGVNVPRAEVARRRAKNKRARAARRLNWRSR